VSDLDDGTEYPAEPDDMKRADEWTHNEDSRYADERVGLEALPMTASEIVAFDEAKRTMRSWTPLGALVLLCGFLALIALGAIVAGPPEALLVCLPFVIFAGWWGVSSYRSNAAARRQMRHEDDTD
jgi:hypothetical protein